jgi:two-component system CheB/CheR fusion protein
MATFLVFAAVLGPAIGALLAAAIVVRAGHSGDFWLTFAEWCLSNSLTAVTLFPMMLSAACWHAASRPLASRARWIEAIALLGGLVVTCVAAFDLELADPRMLPVTLYMPLPFLLWAAVRFESAFASASLLVVGSLTVWGALHGTGPFVAASPTHNLLQLQLFLVALALPLLLLSALVQESRRTSRALHASREQYRSIVEDQTEMICRFRPDGTYVFVNAAYAAFYGRAPEAFVGKSMSAVLPPDAYSATRARIAMITRQSPVVTSDSEAVNARGDRRQQQWRDRGFFDAQRRVLEYQSVGRDITDRYRADVEASRVAAQTEIARTLREADRRKDEFLALLGHELRNPLAPIGLALETLRSREIGDVDARNARDVIARQVRHMTRLVSDLLDVSRITRGAITLRLEIVDLRDVVAQALESARPMIDAQRHAMIVSLPADPLPARGDVTRLVQVVGNLLHNAAKYTAPEGRIELSARREGDSHVLRVRDNGVGISAEMLPRIFELFIQAPGRGDRAREGLGVGLTLAQRIAQLHGGSIEVYSEGRGRGSEFSLKLLAVDETPAPRPDTPVEVDVRSFRLKILIVDDNVDAAEALAALLSRWGHETRTVHDGEAGLSAASRFEPDLVLLDLDLPQIDGFAVARELREKYGARMLIVALSGFSQRHHLERAREVGFDRYITKPVGVPALRAVLAWGTALRV